jgi:hypothetical protein
MTISNFICLVVTYPFELANTRLTADMNRKERRHFTKISEVFRFEGIDGIL